MNKIDYKALLAEKKTLRELIPESIESPAIKRSAEKILQDIKLNGDHAISAYTLEFDKVAISPDKFQVTKEEFTEAKNSIPESIMNALEKAADYIRTYHQKQMDQTIWDFKQENGFILNQITRPIPSVGLYIPGGRYPYPSTVLMTGIPAKVAQVSKIIAVSPPQKNGTINPVILYACQIAGITELYKVGGIQAIGALTFGSKIIPSVTKIVGPGNQYVSAAKKMVNQRYGMEIDTIAGPSEIMIVADNTANPYFIALDLLSQAEHDPNSISILLSTDTSIIEKVSQEISIILEGSDAISPTIKSALAQGGFLVNVEGLETAISIINDFAPEHLSIVLQNPKPVLKRILNAGAIVVGQYSPVAATDYGAGLNHVLPTSSYAKTKSGLSTHDFLKTIGVLHADQESLRKYAPIVISLAEAEGLKFHSLAVRERVKKTN